MIVVAGEALIDLIIDPAGGLVARPGGGPYNAARTIGRLGAPATFLGMLSDDHFGRMLHDGLTHAGVHLGCPTPTAAPTTLAVAELSDKGSASYRFYLDGTSLPTLSAREAWDGLPDDYTALHVGTLGIVVEPTAAVLEALVESAAAKHLIMLDPNCRPAVVPDRTRFSARVQRLLRRADLVKVSDEDVDFLLPDGGWDELIAPELDRGAVVLHTAGSEPTTITTSEGTASVESRKGEIVDTVGAGDIFGATALWAMVEAGWRKGHPLPLAEIVPCVETAAAAAFFACQRAGAEPPTRAELRELHRQA